MTRYLLDSQVLIWHKMERPRVSAAAIALLESQDTHLGVSLVSFWELAIKESLGKLDLPGQVHGLYSDWLAMGTVPPLTLNWNHIRRVKNLPLIHRDPFDRMLIAQALEENLTLITADPHISQYPGVNVLW